MKKTFFILIFLFSQLVLTQQKDNPSPKLLEIGFRMNLPFIAMNYHICDAKLYKQAYKQGPMELVNEWIEAGYDVLGLYFSAGINFTKNWQFEFRPGIAINHYRPPVYNEGLTVTTGFILKRYLTDRKFYWAILMYISYNAPEIHIPPSQDLDGWVNETRKELLGVGFGAKIWKGLYIETSLHGVLGMKAFYEIIQKKWCDGVYYEHKKARLIGFWSINIGYSFGIFRK